MTIRLCLRLKQTNLRNECETQSAKTIESIDRRKLLIGAGAIVSVASAGAAWGASVHQHQPSYNKQGIIDASIDCIKKGQACVDHCLELFKTGDTSVAECADAVHEMLAICTALSQFASYQSRHLKSLAKVCIDVCQDCENECRKHAEKHAACKACANACANCIEECQKIVG